MSPGRATARQGGAESDGSLERSTEENKAVISEAIADNPKLKKKREEEKRKRLESDGLDLFFKNSNNFIAAGDDEFEGHYPGNQNNAILIPKKRRVTHS